jgi:Mg2+/Co2+ transporter CorB
MRVGLLTFTISFIISFLLQFSLAPVISAVILFFVVSTGIIFDIIGTAVTAANEMPFHAMGADKVRGSRQAVALIRQAGKVANFCNDVVGDICGTISGAIIAGIVLEFAQRNMFLPRDILNALAIAFVAAFNVGGKAFGKSYAIENAAHIIFQVGKLLSYLKFLDLDPKRKRRKGKAYSRKGK